MAEKRQIQFERYTNLPLGGNWAGEWPAYVLVHHEGSVDDVRYVPERTCRNVSPDPTGFRCSECGAEDYTSDSMTMWRDGGPVDISFCPNCGARIEGAAS